MTRRNVESQAGGDARGERKPNFGLGRHMLAGTALALLLVVGCGGWAASANLNGAVIAQGSIKVDQNLKEVQHRDGGVVQAIAVRQGDRVEAGQTLFWLDDVQTKAELSIIRSQLGENLGRKARLIAERDTLAAITFPAEFARYSEDAAQTPWPPPVRRSQLAARRSPRSRRRRAS
ncbi:biotin/lipoyl-binding protein [Bosea sp. BIWAKO-01]|uniref:biotin/lipoyl-binding protein n=1 Tax=Bosea sp. BIWAKO-01 TaxID=506668 RepID=UPI000853E9B0|nr:HlyD family secretion protein [Bosea sp. BIWAKO-01]